MFPINDWKQIMNISNSNIPLSTQKLLENNHISVLTISEICTITTLSKSTIYRMIKRGNFPRPISLSSHRSGFLVSEIESWIATKVNHAHLITTGTSSTPMNPARHTSQDNGYAS